MTFLIIIFSTLFGYWFANFRNKKKLEIARLVGIKDFVYGYCENLKGMCDSMLEKVQTQTIDDEEKTRYAHMLATLSNVHDELVDIWKKGGESKLSELLQETISDKEVFGKELDKRMKDLVEFEDQLSADNPTKGLEHIAENYRLIEEIRGWVRDYSKNQDSYVKTVAIETLALLDAKEGVLKMIENSLKTNKDAPGEEAKDALEKQAYHTDRYANAMKLLFGA